MSSFALIKISDFCIGSRFLAHEASNKTEKIPKILIIFDINFF